MSLEKGNSSLDLEKLEITSKARTDEFEVLNDDCLIAIISHLPVADRVKIERVSKTWKKLSKHSWSTLKKLKLDPRFLNLRPIGTKHYYPEINSYVVEEILKRCGIFLNEIDFVYHNSVCMMSLIALYCPNIQNISCYEVSDEGIENLSRNCKNISQ